METLPKCSYDNPESVVKVFILAMNRWETEAWQAMRAVRNSDDPASYQTKVKKKLDAIFAMYCTPKDRPYGRLGSFQKPPEYDPTKEHIQCSTIEKRKAYVDTVRDSVLGGGCYRYVLLRKNSQWRIDNLKHDWQSKWEKAIL